MQLHRLSITVLSVAIVLGVAAGLGAIWLAQAAPAQGPCAQIVSACQQAGFARGDARAGNGLLVDCINPIMQGGLQRPRANRSLPPIDAQLVAACKKRNPNFGQRNARPSPGAPPAPEPESSVSPRAAAAPTLPTLAPKTTGGRRPNIVFILTDDLAWNLVQFMPNVLKMQRDGVTFANYLVTDSLCCPSRSSISTGRYPHNTGIFRNVGQDGGYLGFRDRGHERSTFATVLSAAGYRTAMLGKYLNGYRPQQDGVGPGWSSWAVGGNAYREFQYVLNQDGKIARYGDSPSDYLTDVLSNQAVDFIKQTAGAPFAIEIATFAPHAPYTPAPRDANALPGLRAPRSAAFNAAPDDNAPTWLREHRPLSDSDIANIDRDFRKRAQSVLAVDKMIGELQAAVAAIGEADNTYFVFSSDNGYHMGEHRLLPGKMTAYDTDIHVPLIVTGPGLSAGRTVQEIAENIDLNPTFAEIGGVASPANIDGRSLLPLLLGREAAEWQTVALIEHHGPVRNLRDPDLPSPRSGNPTTYEAIRSADFLYVEYANGEKEYHNLTTDRDELRNTYQSLPDDEKARLHVMLGNVSKCQGAKSCSTAEHLKRGAMQ
jgi:N-acetylglucosamine-6-sulfatase